MDLERDFGIDPTNWQVRGTAKCYMRKHPESLTVALRGKVERMGDLPVSNHVMPWQLAFQPASMKKRKWNIWHATNSTVALRLTLLAAWLEVDETVDERLAEDHRVAAAQVNELCEAFSNPLVKEKMKKLLSDDGWSQLQEEMESVGYSIKEEEDDV